MVHSWGSTDCQHKGMEVLGSSAASRDDSAKLDSDRWAPHLELIRGDLQQGSHLA